MLPEYYSKLLPKSSDFPRLPVNLFFVFVLTSWEYLVSISPVCLTQSTWTLISLFKSLIEKVFWGFTCAQSQYQIWYTIANTIKYDRVWIIFSGFSRLELIFFVVAIRGLCFGYVLKRVMPFKAAQYCELLYTKLSHNGYSDFLFFPSPCIFPNVNMVWSATDSVSKLT